MVLQPSEIGLGDESSSVEVQEIRVGHRAVLAIVGEIDIATAERLQAAIDGVLESGASEVWIDLTRVAFMDSTGLKVLLTARTRLSATSRALAIICPPGPVRRVFELAGLDHQFAIHADRPAAHAAG